MWSSVRRYRGRNTRDDDISFTCTCITDWCFAWCSNQCAKCNKKPEHRPSVSSDADSDADDDSENKCCSMRGCFVRTIQVQANIQDSQNIHDASEQAGWGPDIPAIEVDPNKMADEEDGFSYWTIVRRLRRLRPRIFGGRTTVASVVNEAKAAPPRLSGFRRLGMWFRELGQRVMFLHLTPATTATPSSAVAEEVAEEGVTEEQNIYDIGNVSPWGDDPFIVFAKGKCGYESFDPNCCRLWQTINYAINEDEKTGMIDERRPASRERPASRDLKTVDVARPGSGRHIHVNKGTSNLPTSSSTVIPVSSEKAQDSELQNLPKQTLIHKRDSVDMGKNFADIEKPEVSKDILMYIGQTSVSKDTTSGVVNNYTNTVPVLKTPQIPEVILTRATPDTKADASRSSVLITSNVPKANQGTIHQPPNNDKQKVQSSKDTNLKTDILNFMTKPSPKRVSNPETRANAPKTDIRRKVVRFKEPSFSHSTTKGRAVYIGTSKNTAAPKRETIDLTVEVTKVSGGVSFHDPSSDQPGQGHQERQLDPGSPKGVKAYVDEYSELCKASVDQERHILQSVIDSVRECYNMPSPQEEKVAKQTK